MGNMKPPNISYWEYESWELMKLLISLLFSALLICVNTDFCTWGGEEAKMCVRVCESALCVRVRVEDRSHRGCYSPGAVHPVF